jgi:LytS/YehU family sensor histidine kinase
LLLQPLVENAIKHGISKRIAGGTIRITGTERGGALYLRVTNEGPPPPEDFETASRGVGISNLRTRLRILYGDESDLKLRSGDPDGAEVVVTLPRPEA